MSFRTDLDAILLACVTQGPAHGYDLVQRIKIVSEDLLTVGEGRLYPALHRLEKAGLIEAEWVPQEGRPDRKVYSITEKGTQALEAKRSAWRRFSESVSRILSPNGQEA